MPLFCNEGCNGAASGSSAYNDEVVIVVCVHVIMIISQPISVKL